VSLTPSVIVVMPLQPVVAVPMRLRVPRPAELAPLEEPPSNRTLPVPVTSPVIVPVSVERVLSEIVFVAAPSVSVLAPRLRL
jgi:hypothetical protein